MAKRNTSEINVDVADKMKEIGERLNKLRQAKNPNYKNFAKEIGISNMTLWRMQKGEDFQMSTFISILNKLGITLEDFFKDL